MSKAPRWTLGEIFVSIIWIAVGMALFRLANSALAQVAYHPTLAVVAWSGCGIGVGIGVGNLDARPRLGRVLGHHHRDDYRPEHNDSVARPKLTSSSVTR